MLNLKEIRIGNHVKLDGALCRVQIGDLLKIETQDFEPIKLTDEILKQYGFKKDIVFFVDESIYFIDRNNHFRIEKTGSGYYFDETKIESLHHLQNIYFDIVGELLVEKL